MSLYVFDMDDVVRNIRDAAQRAFLAETGIDFHWEDISEQLPLSKVYGAEVTVHWPDIFLKHKVLENGTLEAGVSELFEVLNARGDTIQILTHCGWHPNAYRVCMDFFKEHSLTVDRLLLLQPEDDKANTLVNMGEVQCFLDDRLDNVIPASTLPNVKHSVLVTRPWNVHDSSCKRVSDLRDCLLLH